MDDKRAIHKEKSETGRDSGGYTDIQNMDNEGARPKEKSDTNRDSDKYRDRHNIDNKGARPKEKSDIIRDSGGLRDGHNIYNKGARPKEKSDTMRGSGGFRDGHNIDNNGARPKEKSDTMRGNEKFRDRQNMDNKGKRPKKKSDTIYNLLDSGKFRYIHTVDNKGAKHKEKNDTMRDTDRYRDRQSMDSQLSFRSDTSQFVSHLSVHMCDILERVGASASFRALRQDCALSKELLRSLYTQLHPPPATYFQFGSSSEGTTTPGLNSDTDILKCHHTIPIVDNISDAVDEESFLMIREKHTKPGYVKLQDVHYGQPQTVYMRDIDHDEEESDGEGRICLKHISLIGQDDYSDERNGPADTSIEDNCDIVQGFRCSFIPKFSTKWIVRTRPYKWPSKHMLYKMAKMGCFVVGVGHPTSQERDIEWRLSFSLQERELMFSMNLVQHKCYILLKLIKKDLIEPFIGNILSSYHFKTCILYVIENTKSKLWKRSNLVQCVLLCLHVLLKWVHSGYCPNYFIPEENMFDRDIHRTQRENIVQHLKHLLSNGCEFFFQIKRDYISDLLRGVTENFEMDNTLFAAYFDIKLKMISEAVRCKEGLYHTLNKSSTHIEDLIYLHTLYMNLSQTKCLKDHTEQKTQEVLSYVIPYVHKQLAQSYASQPFSIDEIEAKYRLLKSCKHHLIQGRRCDMTSSRLLQVTILYKLELYEQCIPILNHLELELNQKSLSLCVCGRSADFNDSPQKLYKVNVSSILRRVSTCTVFLHSNMAIIPEALQYEMYRSVGTPDGSRNRSYDGWMDMAVVDAEVYLHFMKYIAYANSDQSMYKHVAIQNLESILKHEQNLGHRETGYNLIGWIHFQEGWIKQGIKYFRKSWSIRPHHNAAKFHVMFYIFGERNNQT